MSEPKTPDYMLVNRKIFVACFKAQRILLETYMEQYESIKNSGYNEETKHLSLSLLDDHIKSLYTVLNGLEECIADRLEVSKDLSN